MEKNEWRHHATFARLLAGLPGGANDSAEDFACWATTHRIAPYAGHLAFTLDLPLHARLKTACREAAVKEMLYAQPTRRLLAALLGAGARPIAFKGLGTAHLCYPEPYLRPLGDLDLLFRPGDIDTVIATCVSLGYRHLNPDPAVVTFVREGHYNIPLTHPDFGLLEAHRALYRDCEDAFTEGMLARCTPIFIFGNAIERPTSEDLFILLAVHWGISAIGSNWLWLLDLVLLGRSFDAAAWAGVRQTAGRHGLQIFVAAALSCMQKLWQIPFVSADLEASFTSALRPAEALAKNRVVAMVGMRTAGSHVLSMARRLSGRPVRGSRLLASIVCHPGVVCIELGVSSTAPGFWRHRLRHPIWRIKKAVTSLVRT